MLVSDAAFRPPVELRFEVFYLEFDADETTQS